MPDIKYFEGENALDDFYEEMNLDFNKRNTNRCNMVRRRESDNIENKWTRIQPRGVLKLAIGCN